MIKMKNFHCYRICLKRRGWQTSMYRLGRSTVLSTKDMVPLLKVTLLSQRHLEHPGIVTPVGAFRSQLRLITMQSLTLSRSPQLLQLETNSPPSVIETGHLEYVSTVRNLATYCLRVPRYVLSVSRKRLRCV